MDLDKNECDILQLTPLKYCCVFNILNPAIVLLDNGADTEV